MLPFAGVNSFLKLVLQPELIQKYDVGMMRTLNDAARVAKLWKPVLSSHTSHVMLTNPDWLSNQQG